MRVNDEGVLARWHAERFGGFDQRQDMESERRAQDMCNFRVEPDGSLTCREGYVPIAVLGEAIRGAFYHEADGQRWLYAVAGRRVYCRCLDYEDTMRVIGEIASESGHVDFAEIDGAVLLMDGVTMMCLTPSAVTTVMPYIPLYGNGWGSIHGGAVYEERNLLTDLIRVRYVMEGDAVQMMLRLNPLRLIAVYSNGKALTNWAHDIPNAALEFGHVEKQGNVIDVLMELAAAENTQRAAFFGCRMTERLTDDVESARLFGGGADGGMVFRTQQVSLAARSACREMIPEATTLYLLEEGCLRVGDGIHTVKAFARQYDRLLLFTEAQTLMTDSKRLTAQSLGLQTVNPSLGCSVQGAAVTVGNNPVTLCGRTLLRWTDNTDKTEACNAKVFSLPIASLLTQQHATQARMLYDRSRDEVLIYIPSVTGRILVWNAHLDCFYSYDGVDPDGMLMLGEQLAFYRGKGLYIFSPEARGDTDIDGVQKAIVCRWESHDVSFGHTGRALHIGQARLCINAMPGSKVKAWIETERGRGDCLCFRVGRERPCEIVRRANVGRFRHLRLRLRCECEGEFRLMALCLTARC